MSELKANSVVISYWTCGKNKFSKEWWTSSESDQAQRC